MQRILLMMSLIAIPSLSFAYDAQLEGDFSYLDYDEGIFEKAYQTDLKGTFYFDTVQTKNYPLNEAAFLGHNSNVYVKYNYHHAETPDEIIPVLGTGDLYQFGFANAEFNNHHFSTGIEAFFEQFYLNGELGYVQSETEVNVNSSSNSYLKKIDIDAVTYRALIGFTPITNLLVAVGVDGYQGDDEDENDLAVKAKYVTSIGQNGQYLNLELEGLFGDYDNAIFAADYYFNRSFSLGGAFYLNDDNVSEYNMLSVRSKYFLAPNFAVGAEVGINGELRLFNVNASYRF